MCSVIQENATPYPTKADARTAIKLISTFHTDYLS
jgi:hypothetical protein